MTLLRSVEFSFQLEQVLLNHGIKDETTASKTGKPLVHRPQQQHLLIRGWKAAQRPQAPLFRLWAFLAEGSALAAHMVHGGNSQHLSAPSGHVPGLEPKAQEGVWVILPGCESGKQGFTPALSNERHYLHVPL